MFDVIKVIKMAKTLIKIFISLFVYSLKLSIGRWSHFGVFCK